MQLRELALASSIHTTKNIRDVMTVSRVSGPIMTNLVPRQNRPSYPK